MGPSVFSLCYFNSSNCRSLFYFQLAFLNTFLFQLDKCHAWPRPLHNHIACTSLRPGEEATEKIWCTIDIVLICQNTFNFSILL